MAARRLKKHELDRLARDRPAAVTHDPVTHVVPYDATQHETRDETDLTSHGPPSARRANGPRDAADVTTGYGPTTRAPGRIHHGTEEDL